MNSNINYSISNSSLTNAFFWKLLERGGSQLINFVISLIIARLLEPESYGIIAISSIFINFLNIFIQNGFNVSLIRKKTVDEYDYSTCFYLILFTSLLCVGLIYIISPIISSFYNLPILTNLMNLSSTLLIFGAFNSIQNVIIIRNNLFRKQFYINSVSITLSGITGIIFAVNGFGIWALAVQVILNQIINIILLSFVVKWWPNLKFSIENAKAIFSFGKYHILSIVLESLSRDINQLVVGKFFKSQVLGVYSRGQQFPSLILNNINNTISVVLLPFFSKFQEDLEKLKLHIRHLNAHISFLVFPMYIGLSIIASPLVLLVLGEKWMGSVFFIQIFSFSSIFSHNQTIYSQAISALGRSDVQLRIEFYKRFQGLLILFVSLPFGIIWISYGILISSVISFIISSYYVKKLFNYKFSEQTKDLLPSLLLTGEMFLISYIIRLFVFGQLMNMLLSIIVSIIVYLISAIILRNNSIDYYLRKLKEIL